MLDHKASWKSKSTKSYGEDVMKQFRLTLKRGLIGTTQRQRDAIRCLGLRRINHQVVVKDSPAMRGQIMSVQHLLEVKVEGQK